MKVLFACYGMMKTPPVPPEITHTESKDPVIHDFLYSDTDSIVCSSKFYPCADDNGMVYVSDYPYTK